MTTAIEPMYWVLTKKWHHDTSEFSFFFLSMLSTVSLGITVSKPQCRGLATALHSHLSRRGVAQNCFSSRIFFCLLIDSRGENVMVKHKKHGMVVGAYPRSRARVCSRWCGGPYKYRTMVGGGQRYCRSHRLQHGRVEEGSKRGGLRFRGGLSRCLRCMGWTGATWKGGEDPERRAGCWCGCLFTSAPPRLQPEPTIG